MVMQVLNLRLQFDMEMKVKVYTLTDEGASAKGIGSMKGEDGESLVAPKSMPRRIEDIKV